MLHSGRRWRSVRVPAGRGQRSSDLDLVGVEGLLGGRRLGLGVGENLVDGFDDALAGGAHDLLGGEVAGGLAGPAGDVAEGVLRGIQTVRSDDHERHALGFDLADSAAVHEASGGGGVGHQDVAQLVGEHPDTHRLIDIVADTDGAVAVTGDAVRVAAVTAFEPVAVLVDEFNQPIPQPRWRLPGEQDRLGCLRYRRPVALADVESCHRLHANDLAGLSGPTVRVEYRVPGGVQEGNAAGNRPEDADRLLALADLVSLGLPGPVPAYRRGVASLTHYGEPVQKQPSGIASDAGFVVVGVA